MSFEELKSPRRQAREISSDRLHLSFGHVAAHVAHFLMRALARMKCTQLIEQIRRVLSRKIGRFAIFRNSVRTVARRAAGGKVTVDLLLVGAAGGARLRIRRR